MELAPAVAAPAAVELAGENENGREESADAPQLTHEPTSWIIEGSGAHRDSVLDPDRASTRQSTGSVATEEEVQVELQKEAAADRKLGITRPPGYMKLGSRTPFPVARAPADLTPNWLTTVLRYRKLLPADAAVTEVETKLIGEAGGVMGVIVLVTMTMTEGTPESTPRRLVAKFSPQGKAPLPRFMIRAVFKAEAHFYNDFTIDDGGMTRPVCYLALYDSRRRVPTFCLLLEDMMPRLSSTVLYSRLDCCDDLGKLKAAAGGLARLHARWWNQPKAPPLDWLLHPSRDYGGLVLNGFMQTTKDGIAALSKVYKEAYAPIVAWLPELKRRHKYILDVLFAPPLTMAHGDAHIENIFFDGRFKGGAAFIDFGNMMFSQGCCDVAFFMCHSIDVETRRKTEEAVVKHYHATLLSSYSYERCWFDYRFNLWRALISLLAMGPSVEKQHRRRKGIFAEDPTPADLHMRKMYEQLNERCVTALLDHDWLKLCLEGDTFCGVCSCLPFCF